MQNTIQKPAFISRPVQVQSRQQASGGLFMNGLLLLVSIPAAIITLAILVAMVPVRILGTLFK